MQIMANPSFPVALARRSSRQTKQNHHGKAIAWSPGAKIRFSPNKCGSRATLTRLRCNTVPYAIAPKRISGQRGRSRKYGARLGTCAEKAARLKTKASSHRVFFYGRYRDVMATTRVVMLKTIKCPVRVVWVFRKTQ